ncbi:hypothetical protein [Mesorhizobium zhangyense]|nr:hypothetical protein [Mesorhizobium zhangyense]
MNEWTLFESDTDASGRMPAAGKVDLVAVVGNEAGARIIAMRPVSRR